MSYRKVKPTADPRVPGGRYYCGYWREEYTVLAVEDRNGVRWITEATDAELANGASRTHCTAWDAKRDRVISHG